MIRKGLPYLMALIPGAFYLFVVLSYILHEEIGFRLPMSASYIVSAVLAAGYCAVMVRSACAAERQKKML